MSVELPILTGNPTKKRPPYRVLVIWPPQVLSYFNAGHHLALYQVTDYLRLKLPDAKVDVMDAPVEGVGWKDLADQLYSAKYDAIAIMNDFDGIDGLPRFLDYARKLCPTVLIVGFGRLCGMNAGYFRGLDLDAIVVTGDFESGVFSAIQWFRDPTNKPPGVDLRVDGHWSDAAGPGDFLSPSDWPLPTHDEIPYGRYDDLYRRDARKFPGLPSRRELVVPVARGCPVGCAYCEVPVVFGLKERRLSVDAVVDYIVRSFAAAPFDYVSFYAPTFTLNKRWVLELCSRLNVVGVRYPWKCCTTVHHLDEELVAAMGRSGCVRISVGLETLEATAYDGLPKLKRNSDPAVAALAVWCSRANVELNCFVVVGLPGTSIVGAKQTIDFVRSLGARVRPTVYTPYESMTADMSAEQIAALNRQIFVDGSHTLSAADLDDAYGLIFGSHGENSSAADQVPNRKKAT